MPSHAWHSIQAFGLNHQSRLGESNSLLPRTEGVSHHLDLTGKLSRRWESNPHPAVYKTAAPPLCYSGELAQDRPRQAWTTVPLVEPTGFEPVFLACRARVLPLDDGPIVESRGIEPLPLPCESSVLPLSLRPHGGTDRI